MLTPSSNNMNIFCAVRVPLYEQVKNAILEKIRSGEWAYESMIPNEIELAHLFNVSQGTIRRAVRELCDENFLIRKQGRGTFVCSYNSELSIFRKKFIYVKSDAPEGRWLPITKCTLFEIITPSSRVSKLLGLDATEEVIHIRREHCNSKESEERRIECFDELFLPKKFFPTLTKEVFDAHKEKSLYQFYQNSCGVTIAHANDQLKATLLNPEQAALAKVTLPYPAIISQRISYDIDNNACELRYLITITDACHISIAI